MKTRTHLPGAGGRHYFVVPVLDIYLAEADVPGEAGERVRVLIAGECDRARRLRNGIDIRRSPAPRQETATRRLHAPHAPPASSGSPDALSVHWQFRGKELHHVYPDG